MNPSNHSTIENPTLQPSPNADATNETDHLREILKRCPASTYEAARQYRATGDTRHIPTIALGIIERFVESDLRAKLRQPSDALLLGEDLGLDSLTMMEMVILVEDVFSLTIRNEELRSLRTLGDVRKFIADKIKDHAAPGKNPSGSSA